MKYSEQIPEQYDIIIGSDLIYKGCCFKELAGVIDKLLKYNGSAFIIIPKQRQCIQEFVSALTSLHSYEIHALELDSQIYKENALEGEGISDRVYPGIKELDFVVYEFWKKAKNFNNNNNNNSNSRSMEQELQQQQEEDMQEQQQQEVEGEQKSSLESFQVNHSDEDQENQSQQEEVKLQQQEVKQEEKEIKQQVKEVKQQTCLLYTSPSPRDRQKSRMPSSA
eukprot:TRINITY_DN2894_c0_g2_i1.p1 TRINITY_DN2894_c0_g2~~TRINITY_DN2894_c0_g2_i1.p1  ORF type:complete len:223 (-),score=69.67 TRINITY_DN2894_c0_g2_i1:34-702(-)